MTQNRWYFDSMEVEANGVAILAIERMIRKSPIKKKQAFYIKDLSGNDKDTIPIYLYYCPNCGQVVEKQNDCCNVCTQMLKWGDTNDNT